jgi:PT repeat
VAPPPTAPATPGGPFAPGPFAPGSGAPPPHAPVAKSSKAKVIGLIGGGVAAVGIVGLLAAVLLKGGDDQPVAQPTDQPGVLDPTPVVTGQPTTEPTGEPTTEPTGEPTAEPTGEPVPEADSLQLPNGVVVPLLEGWNGQVSESGRSANLFGPDGDYMFVTTFNIDPTVDAAADVSSFSRDLISADHGYSGVQFAEVETFPPFGSLLSLARVYYGGVYTDNQGSLEVEGLVFEFIRQDGTGVGMIAEYPAGELNPHQPVWSQVLDGVIDSFAGS